MSETRVLIVDDDTWILKMVSTVLEKRGLTVETACDGHEALERVKAHTPDLVITDVQMPRMDGWALIRVLRTRPETAFTPVIFLTALGSDEDRIRGFRLGADDYLPKPFRFEELDLRVQIALRRSGGLRSETQKALTPSTGLAGELTQVGLSSVLVLLEMEKKSGVLVLTHKGETIRIFLRQGTIVRAAIEGRSEPRGATCVYRALAWGEGKFEFSALAVDMADEIKSSTTHLLMEGARLIDETRNS